MEVTLVKLQGNDKQVEWATDIRARYIASMQERIDEVLRPSNWNELNTDLIEKLRVNLDRALFGIVSFYPSASWWIDKRDRIKKELAEDWELAMSVMFMKDSKRIKAS
ncbi:hypothetical protein [Alicyclobacillus fodiniaquatilis]|uniref:Uncharacterized protein n=1 Tax=Alicyclobacillus fodiniaquatilis TaxID=1661150 RepID=A0ABW4JIB2_9BACL